VTCSLQHACMQHTRAGPPCADRSIGHPRCDGHMHACTCARGHARMQHVEGRTHARMYTRVRAGHGGSAHAAPQYRPSLLRRPHTCTRACGHGDGGGGGRAQSSCRCVVKCMHLGHPGHAGMQAAD
jgi:hypothetical protein